MAKKLVTVKGMQYQSLSDAAKCFCLNPKLVQGRVWCGSQRRCVYSGKLDQLETWRGTTVAPQVKIDIDIAGKPL